MIVSKIKTDQRIKHNSLDEEINDVIISCVEDLKKSGVKIDLDNLSSLQEATIKMFCRAWYDFEGKGEVYQERYNKMKISLAVNSEVPDV